MRRQLIVLFCLIGVFFFPKDLFSQHIKIHHISGGFSLINLVNTSNMHVDTDTLKIVKDGGETYNFPKDQIEYYKFYANTQAEITNGTGNISISALTYLKVYPNPTVSILKYEFDTQLKGILNLEIISNDGKSVLSLSEDVGAGLNNGEIDLSNIISGHYFLRFTLGQTTINEPIIINK